MRMDNPIAARTHPTPPEVKPIAITQIDRELTITASNLKPSGL